MLEIMPGTLPALRNHLQTWLSTVKWQLLMY